MHENRVTEELESRGLLRKFNQSYLLFVVCLFLQLFEYDQSEFFVDLPETVSMDSTGYVYVPSGCQSKKTGRLSHSGLFTQYICIVCHRIWQRHNCDLRVPSLSLH